LFLSGYAVLWLGVGTDLGIEKDRHPPDWVAGIARTSNQQEEL
jgi:hypothetical protein